MSFWLTSAITGEIMTRLEWDNVGERFFEVGVDRCVLYIPEGTLGVGVAWSGITGITEASDESSTGYFLDGVKYMDVEQFDTFKGSIKAFTYPYEFEQFIGAEEESGLLITEQPAKRFHLSYRTKLGNDVDGVDHGYLIHILWNVLAIPDTISRQTIGESVDPVELSWTITAQPDPLIGARPTAHLILDSTELAPGLLSYFEGMLYGTETDDAYITNLQDIIDMLTLTIVDNGDGTWTIVKTSDDDITLSEDGEFEIRDIDATVIDANTYTMNTIP